MYHETICIIDARIQIVILQVICCRNLVLELFHTQLRGGEMSNKQYC